MKTYRVVFSGAHMESEAGCNALAAYLSSVLVKLNDRGFVGDFDLNLDTGEDATKYLPEGQSEEWQKLAVRQAKQGVQVMEKTLAEIDDSTIVAVAKGAAPPPPSPTPKKPAPAKRKKAAKPKEKETKMALHKKPGYKTSHNKPKPKKATRKTPSKKK